MYGKKTHLSLQQLRFDPKLLNTFIGKYFANPRLVILLLFLILTIGISSYLTLPRTLNPEIKIPIVLVSTIVPGANPTDVEQLVTIPIEDAVAGLENVKKITSSSRESASIVNIEFDSGTDPDKARDNVQGTVDSLSDLSKDATTPQVFKLDFENQPILQLALVGSVDDGSLFTFANSLKEKLEDLPEIDRANLSGIEQKEVEVTIKPETAASYKVSPFGIFSLIQNSLKTFPAGSVKTDESSFALSIDPQVVTIDDIRTLRINLEGQNLSLSDIAFVSEHPKPDQQQSFFVKGKGVIQRSVTLDIFRVKTTNIDASVRAAENLIDKEIEANGNKFEIVTLINTSEEIDDQFNELVRDFFIVIVLVMLVLFIFLGARQAIVSALSAPLTFLITFAVMGMLSISHNFLSLFSLLLSLGLLVDDTVVVISAMTAYFRTGRFTPLQTALLVWRDFITPIFTTTITTIWAFLPLLLSTGIIGEFIKSIPIVVSTALAGSLIVGMFVTMPIIIILLSSNIPVRVRVSLVIFGVIMFVLGVLLVVPKNPMLVHLLLLAIVVFLFITSLVWRKLWEKGRRFRKYDISKAKAILTNGIISFDRINNEYRSIIEKILISPTNRKKAILMVVVFSIFSFALLPLGLVKNEFFPAADSKLIFVSLELPAGANLATTKKEALKVLRELAKTPDAKYISSDIGRGFNQQVGITGATSNNVLFTINLVEKKERERSSQDIAQEIRKKFSSYNKGTLNVQELSGGPPAGAQIQIAIVGEDLTLLNNYADHVKRYLEGQTGVINVEKSVRPGTSKLTFAPDKSLLLEHQITVDQIGLWLRSYASGFTVDKHSFAGESEEKDISFRLSSNSISAEALNKLVIPTSSGNIPLSALGTIKLTPSPTLITREDGKRTISVSAGVIAGVNPQEKNKAIEKFADSDLALKEGYSWKTGGIEEENQQSVQSILQAMLLSFLLIIVTMVVQFSSFRRAIIVMLVIPLSVSGVFIIFALTRTPLSFPALIGLLALFGIVVKNSILLVDKIVQNQKRGMRLIEAIADAGQSRLEPIALTSFCTIVGLIPITLSDPLWRGLGGAIIAGLTFSGTIMLFFIPVVYYYFFKPRNS